MSSSRTARFLFPSEDSGLLALFEVRRQGAISAAEALSNVLALLDPSSLLVDLGRDAMEQACAFDARYPPGSWLPALAGLPLFLQARTPTDGGDLGRDYQDFLCGTGAEALIAEGAILAGIVRGSVGPPDHEDQSAPRRDGPTQIIAAGGVCVGLAPEVVELGLGDLRHSVLARASLGLDGYRPTLGLAPSSCWPPGPRSVGVVMTPVAPTLVDQAYVLDRLRARGVRGDPRYLPHSNPKSLATFASAPLPPRSIALVESEGVDEIRARFADRSRSAAVRSPRLDIVVRTSEFGRAMDAAGAQHLADPVGPIGEGEGIDDRAWMHRCAVIAADGLLVDHDVVVVGLDVLEEEAWSEPGGELGWALASLANVANLPMIALARQRLVLIGQRFGDAQLLRIARWLSTGSS